MQVKVRINDLRQVSLRANELNEEINDIFNKTLTELRDICSIVQCSELTSATQNINKEIALINTDIHNSLEGINKFLVEQLNYYSISNENATNAINRINEQLNSTLSANGGGF